MELVESYLVIKALTFECLRAKMRKGEVVRFAYMKKDGTVRVAVGTLQEQAVKANVVGTGQHKKGTLSYIDLEKMAWRSFKIKNLIGIVD